MALIRNNMATSKVAVDKYLGTSYDVIKTVYDNLASISIASDILFIKGPTVASTTVNITLSGEQTIDQVAVVTGDRVLVRSQTNTAENGIYVVNSSSWTRATDFNTSSDVTNGQLVLDSNSGVMYASVVSGTWTPGTTGITFINIAGTVMEDETLLGSAFSTRVGTFTTLTYTPASNNLWVFRNGQKMDVGRDFTETSSTSITLTFDPNDGDQFDCFSNVSLTSRVTDSYNVTHMPAGTGAVATDVQTKLRERVSVSDFNAGTDIANIQAAVAHINTLGGGTLDFNGQDYSVDTVIGSALFSFSGCNGVTLDFTNSTFTDTTVYTGTASIRGEIFKFTDCNNITFQGELKGTANNYGATTDKIGAGWVMLYGNCNGFNGKINVTGGRNALYCFGTSGTTINTRTRNINADITTVNTSYPYIAGFAGDKATVNINCTRPNRPFFLFSCTQQDISCDSKDQLSTGLVKVFEGQDLDQVNIKYINKETTTQATSPDLIGIHFGDQTQAAIRNVNIDIDVVHGSGWGSDWGSLFTFAKFLADGTSADTTARGHILENIKFSGTADLTNGSSVGTLETGTGKLVVGDYARNVRFCDYRCTGASGNGNIFGNDYTEALDAPMQWNNVSIPNGQISNPSVIEDATITYNNCEATNLTSATSNDSYEVYNDCRITDGTNQSVINKIFNNTEWNGFRKTNLRNELGVNYGSKTLSGDLTGTNNIFKVFRSVGTSSFMIRIKYWMTSDYTGTTNTTLGIETLCASMDSAGTWTSIIAPGAEVTARSTGTASVPTFSLVNGDSTGAHIAVACTNYNGANARGTFVAELISHRDETAIHGV